MDLDDWATRHHGLITRDASQLSDAAWRRALRAGTLDQLHPLVARLPGTPRTREQVIAAAVLAAGPDALASHRSAAHLWGLPRPDGERVVDVTLPGRRRFPTLDGAVVHRPRDQEQLRPVVRAAIPCTDPIRTLLDLGAVDPRGVSGAVGVALGARLVDLEALEAALARHARQGRAGVTALRSAIDDWRIDAKPADSVLEAAMAALVDRYGLPPVDFHQRIEGWEVDFRICGTAILLECDGWTTHGLDRAQFERDRRRDDDLRAAGWIVIRLTFRSIVRRPADTARRIRRAVERWAHLPVPRDR